MVGCNSASYAAIQRDGAWMHFRYTSAGSQSHVISSGPRDVSVSVKEWKISTRVKILEAS